jgi:putative alpha-1,2-mannosidase
MPMRVQNFFRCLIPCSLGVASLAVLAFGNGAWAQKADAAKAKDYTQNIDPFIGVDWGGNTFVGSTIPYGMVKIGRYSCFSHLHLSGAQGKYGNVMVMPVTGPLSLNDIKSVRSEEENHVGYYAAKLDRYQVKAELTSSRRVGFHRYTFLAAQEAHITINLAHALGLGTDWQAQKFLGAEAHDGWMESRRRVQGLLRYGARYACGGRAYMDRDGACGGKGCSRWSEYADWRFV